MANNLQSNDASEEFDGFERLLNTHRRLGERLAVLTRAARDVADPERRYEAVNNLFDVARFLGRAARRHHEDEEVSLFQRLANVSAVAAVVATLRAEHVAHDAEVDAFVAMVRGWDPDEGPSAADEARLPALADALASAYAAHIAREETELFPAAREALGAAAGAEMGQEMIARRR